jgi:hypothetical protein
MGRVVRYIVIAVAGLGGIVCLLLYLVLSTPNDDFLHAAQCPDATSVHCYQLSDGVIKKVTVVNKTAFNASDKQVDDVFITTRNETVDVFMTLSTADARLLSAGTNVTVTWWLGSPVTLRVGTRDLITDDNPTADHSIYAYSGLIMLWFAATSLGAVLINRRGALTMAALYRPRTTGPAGGLIAPRLQDGLLPLVGIGFVGLVSVRLLVNSAVRPIAIAGDIILLGPILIRTFFVLRRSRLTIDASGVSFADWTGRRRSWKVDHFDRAAIISPTWVNLGIPTLKFVATGGTELFSLSSMLWDLQAAASACRAVGIPVLLGERPQRGAWGIDWGRQLERLAVALPLIVMIGLTLFYRR